MKRIFALVLAGLCIMSSNVYAGDLGKNITQAMKSEKYKGMEMKNINGQTFVPVRVLSDEIGATIEFDNDGALRLWYDYSSYRFSKDTYWMPNIGGRLYLPLRDICNKMGLTTTYLDGNVYVKGPVGDKYDYDSNGMLTVGSEISYRERFMKHTSLLAGGLEYTPLVNGDLVVEVVDDEFPKSLGNVDVVGVSFDGRNVSLRLSDVASVMLFTFEKNYGIRKVTMLSGSDIYSYDLERVHEGTGDKICYDYVGVYLFDESYSSMRYSFIGQESNHKVATFRRPDHVCNK